MTRCFFYAQRRKKKNTPDKDGTFCIYHFCFSFSLYLFLSILRFGAVCFGLMIRYLGLECSDSNFFEICNMWLFFGQCDKAREKCLNTVQLMRNEIYTYDTILTVQSTTYIRLIVHTTYNITLLLLLIDACAYTHQHIHTYTYTCWVRQLTMKGHQLPLSTRTRVEGTLLIKQPGLGIRSGASLQ